MAHRKKKRLAQKAGLPPGTIVHTGEEVLPEVGITQIIYDAGSFAERDVARLEEAFPRPGEERTVWINIDGVHRPEMLESIGRRFGLHPLLLEDIAHTEQRPKLEHYGAHLFLEINAIRGGEGIGEIQTEQISLVLGDRWVLSFNERPQPYAKVIRDRLRADKARCRQRGADYLAYSIVDVVVDHYYLVLEGIGDRIEELEEELMAKPTPHTLQAVYDLKREIIHLRKSIWPLREVINALQREKDLIREETGFYLRDLYDHTIQILDIVETYRDLLAGMLEIYLSSVSNRLNEVMRVLTVMSTIFIPLTFIAGVYGMNFRHMPELEWRWGYPALWVAMLVLALGMLRVFRRKKWI